MAGSIPVQEEYCSECGDPTGRCGNFHEPLYYTTSEGTVLGPLCDECYKNLEISEGQDRA